MYITVLHMRFLDESLDDSPIIYGSYQHPTEKGYWLAYHNSMQKTEIKECDENGTLIPNGRKAEFTPERHNDPYLDTIRMIS